MRPHNFRQFFAILLSITLACFGYYIATVLLTLVVEPLFNKNLIPFGRSYVLEFKVGVSFIGLLLGFWVGPRTGQALVQLGSRLEKMDVPDKIAVGTGTFLGVVVSLLLYQILLVAKLPTPLQITIMLVLGAAFIYLGIVSTMSMKTELVAMLARGGAITGTPGAEEASPTANCKILDTNVIIDGRISDVCRTGFLDGPLYIPGFVLEELQHIADSSDGLKRARGRRGLDILNAMQKELPLVVRSWDKALGNGPMDDEVDSRLVRLAKALKGVIVTNDFNLNKVAALQGVQVLNVNELANALKPVVLPGEIMTVGIVKEGKEMNQGVAYLDDGTMIVVEDGRRNIGDTLGVVVTSVLQTVAGKMIFARVRGDEDNDAYEYNRDTREGSGPNGGSVSTNSSGFTRRGTGKKIR